MSGEDLTSSRARRMLPSVSEVLKELTARAQVEPEIAFRAAREVCAEELKRLRDAGGDSIPLEDLVQRAFLRATGANLAPPPPPPPPLVIPSFYPSPGPAAAGTPAPAGPRDVEDPFSETTGAMDLRWDRGDAREPFSEQPVAGAPPQEEPVLESGPVEDVPPVPLLFETDPEPPPRAPILFVDSADAAPPFVRSGVEATVILSPEPEAGEGPGNETLNRLSREAESIDLNAVFPKAPAPASVPFALALEDEEEPRTVNRDLEPGTAPDSDDEEVVLSVPRGGRPGPGREGGGPRVGLLVGIAVGVVALAGLGYLLVGLWVDRGATPPPVAVARPRRPAVPTAAPPPATQAEATPVPTASPAAEPTTAPAVPTVATLQAAAAAATAVPAATAAPTAPAPLARATPVLKPGVAPSPVPVATAPVTPARATTPSRQSRDGLVVTADRAGKPEIYSIHFTSYKDRPSAERDLKRIQGLVGREGFVAEVDLGEKGVWQRVMIGAFATAQEAKAAREELAAKGTQNMGWVYRVVGPEAP